ncbi:hypothetical protein QVD17_06996 [Tagetes erecta]|uniref:Uncharacterized protein n=1 Tax=Tagetes erecta TaxID=13708 RepID=A0AAD8LGL3_TARER|nr:hypothetical protein QVD17_06996 [Tagetes erecta]
MVSLQPLIIFFHEQMLSMIECLPIDSLRIRFKDAGFTKSLCIFGQCYKKSNIIKLFPSRHPSKLELLDYMGYCEA